jgi:hypothetical protein
VVGDNPRSALLPPARSEIPGCKAKDCSRNCLKRWKETLVITCGKAARGFVLVASSRRPLTSHPELAPADPRQLFFLRYEVIVIEGQDLQPVLKTT